MNCFRCPGLFSAPRFYFIKGRRYTDTVSHVPGNLVLNQNLGDRPSMPHLTFLSRIWDILLPASPT